MRIRNIKLNEFIIILIGIIFIWQVLLQNYISIFQYFDEIISCIFFMYFIMSILIKNSIKKIDLAIIIIMFLIIIIGLLGNYKAHIQEEYTPILMDIGNTFKFCLIFLGAKTYFEKFHNKKVIITVLGKCIRAIIIPGVICALINLVTNINMYYDVRYGIRSFQFIFNHAGDLYRACLLMLMILTIDLSYYRNRNELIKKKIYIILMLFLLISTLRSLAIISAIIYLFGYYVFIMNKHIQIKFRYIAIISIISISVGYSNFTFYFLNDTTARAILLRYGLFTMKTYFPLGAGFATYGSYAAKLYYSKLYNLYNFSDYFGLSKELGNFLDDNYWPYIFGEFGFIGTVLTIMLLYYIFKAAYKSIRINNQARFANLFGFTSMVLASFASPSFSHTTAVSMFFIIALISTFSNSNKHTLE
ncbi:hypothetical protein [uncultured Clostridium sp.]|uniref:hypothetical protein n=1 Tax=uncultured Clostridium sp. TaxID=59620 RepID=UPI0028E6E541|nr:hypothetical protein [uncultured Clostridium sp.]